MEKPNGFVYFQQTSTGAASKTFIPSPLALGAVAGPVVAGLVAVVAGFRVLA